MGCAPIQKLKTGKNGGEYTQGMLTENQIITPRKDQIILANLNLASVDRNDRNPSDRSKKEKFGSTKLITIQNDKRVIILTLNLP